MKQMLYCELEKHTLPRRGDRTRFSSVEYMLPGDRRKTQSVRQSGQGSSIHAHVDPPSTSGWAAAPERRRHDYKLHKCPRK